MKTITNIFALVALFFMFLPVSGQDVAAKLSEAESSYASKDLEGTRFALQEALSGINQAIAKEILDIIPKTMGGMACSEKDDNVSGASGFAGISLSRKYGDETKNAQLDVISDSPLIAGINVILSMPAIMGNSDPNQKRIKVGGYKAVLQKQDASEGSPVSYTLQIPLSQSLLTLHVNGVSSENDVMSMANTLPLDKIAKLAQ